MQFKVLKLGTVCRDKGTGLEGTLTHWILNMGKHVSYIFQPKGLDEDGQPVRKLVLEKERLEFEKDAVENVEIPFDILGTQVTDKASGFTGMAVDFIRHINGCFHVTIQPEGMHPKKMNPIQKHDFDLRACAGEKIEQLSEPELAKSKVSRPSPAGDIPRDEPPTHSAVPE
jgi:hypothetical protein